MAPDRVVLTWLDLAVAGILVASCVGAWWLAEALVDDWTRGAVPLDTRFQARSGALYWRAQLKSAEDELIAVRAKLAQTRLETAALEATEATRPSAKAPEEAVAARAKLAASKRLSEVLEPERNRLEEVWRTRVLTLAEAERTAANEHAEAAQLFAWKKRWWTLAVAGVLVAIVSVIVCGSFAAANTRRALKPQWRRVAAVVIPAGSLWFAFETGGVAGLAVVIVLVALVFLWRVRVQPPLSST